MKMIIPMETSGRRRFRVELLMAGLLGATCVTLHSQQTYQWTMDADDNPAIGSGGTVEVQVGSGGVGWVESLEGLPGATGFWDLGQAGQMRIVLATEVIGPAEIALSHTQWSDGVLFTDLLVSVPNATPLSSSLVAAVANSSGLGQWQIKDSVWSVPAGSSVTEAFIDAPFSGVVDSVSVTAPTVVVDPLQLTIKSLGSGQVELSWPASAGAATVESRSVLDEVEAWSPVSGTPQLVVDRYVLTVAADSDATYFRLQQ
jgi:hypothetical protein